MYTQKVETRYPFGILNFIDFPEIIVNITLSALRVMRGLRIRPSVSHRWYSMEQGQ